MYCPNCGKCTVESTKVGSQEHYYENNMWKESTHQCKLCLASFINFDDGSEARAKKEEKERKDLAEYKRLKAKFEPESEV